MRSIFISILILCSFGLSSCQTSPLRQFQKIQTGMDKHEVLEIMGSPITTIRTQSKDKWLYSFYDSGIYYEKELHFGNGFVTYSGARTAPEISAEEKDKKNEEENAKKEHELQLKKKKSKKALQNFEEEVKGNKKIKFVPKFQDL